MAKRVRRLYSSFHPDSYDLELTLQPEKMKFSGRVVINGTKVGRPASRLTLHQKNLKVTSAKVTYLSTKGNQVLEVDRINYQKSYDELRLHFKHQIYPGRFQIELEYSGLINAQLHGIYASRFKQAGKEKIIVCTQFESHSAREAFPSIDEPEAKSVFNLTLKTDAKKQVVISNTDPLSANKEAGLMVIKFAPTPKMSSYLLAFIAGDLKYLEGRTKNNVRVRTYSTPDNVSYSKFALDCAVKTLDFYDQYFAIPYPLSKCDLVALPDFASGAMENWGCITFREQLMLVDPKNTSLDLKQHVANVVAHELTHQWFGNLVTMRWWNDLWLNESFASWMSYLAVDQLFPDWQVWTQFINDEQSIGLKQDSLQNTHPIEVKINNPDEIRVVFDAITYEKGAALITMLQDYLGAEVFRDGIRLYLSEYTYANTDTADLWRALETVSSKPVASFMKLWTSKGGYPLLKAIYSDNNLHLEQHRFYLNPMAEKERTVWPVPLFSDLKLGSKDPFNHRSINLSLASRPGSYLLNKGRKGFYRVIYDDQTAMALSEEGVLSQLSDVDRLGLIADAFEAAKAGYLPTLSALKLLERYFKETSSVVWDTIAAGLGSIRLAMDDEELRESMKPFIRQLVNSELKRLGLKAKASDSHFDKLLRPTILGLAALADEPSVIKSFKELFYSDRRSTIDPDIRGVVYATIARHGNEADFDTLLAMHNSSDSSEEKLKLAAALTSFKQTKLINRSLELITSKDVRSQDVFYWVSYAFSNYHGRQAAWKWFKAKWDWMAENQGEDISFYRLPFYVARCYSSLEFLKEFEEFFSGRLSAAFDRPLKQAIETIQWQADWKKRDLDSIKGFFSDYS